ncbi:hypothetical protein [uncultured Tenacibaculum sp.]|uniref:hypothetical protein n=1 Tax=uncultured Tenacibaculum sp. TaxID=174713 RepID=UPI0026251C47|nr:hypothetical protein [uncultured Tenacibaculum sp.]
MSKNNESLQSLEQLKELKNRYFTAFKDVKHSENTTFTVKLEHNYTNLLNLAHSLINVSQSAIEGLHENELPHCNSFDIVNVLQLTKQLLPFSEAEFLDQINDKL